MALLSGPLTSFKGIWLRWSWQIGMSQDGRCFFHMELPWISSDFAKHWDDSVFNVFQGGNVKRGITDTVSLKLFGIETHPLLSLARD